VYGSMRAGSVTILGGSSPVSGSGGAAGAAGSTGLPALLESLRVNGTWFLGDKRQASVRAAFHGGTSCSREDCEDDPCQTTLVPLFLGLEKPPIYPRHINRRTTGNFL